MHGRVEGARARCAVRGCDAPGEFKAPLQPANFDGPGNWRFLCLDHVREHNAGYNYFEGMSPDEITRAQHPLAGWDRPSRSFAANGGDPPPKWSDFSDPLDAISGRFGNIRKHAAPSRFSKEEQRALDVLGLGEDADRHSVRQRSTLPGISCSLAAATSRLRRRPRSSSRSHSPHRSRSSGGARNRPSGRTHSPRRCSRMPS